MGFGLIPVSGIEDEIAQFREYYNATAKKMDEMFPGNIIAGIFGFKCSKMFEARAEEKNNVKVKL